MKIICDTHCDTLSECFNNNYSIFKNPLSIDIKKLSDYKSYTQFFASFINPQKKECTLYNHLKILNYFNQEIRKYPDEICLLKSFSDLENSTQKIKAFLSVEGADFIDKITDLDILYENGVRMLSLTWNYENRFAGGAYSKEKGLTKSGELLIKKMEELGIILDLSHANKKTFFDTVKIATKPFVLSHSNSYELCKNIRNITKEQFKIVMETGGVVGINYYPLFLNNSDSASIDDIVKHIEYFLSLGGEDNICLGSDFDGIEILPKGIKNVSDVKKIFEKLNRIGVNDSIKEKIAYKNIYRIMRICL